MAILDTILSTPVDIPALKVKAAPKERLLDGAFCNLLHYAKSHWKYTASGSTGGDALMSGAAIEAPCGGIATATLILFLYLPQEKVMGFQGAWAMFDATKKQVEKALGSKYGAP